MVLGFYCSNSGLSPHHQLKSHGELTVTRMKTKVLAQDVQDVVEQDFTLYYHVTDTEQFLNKLLPVEKATLDAILQYMKNKNLYDSTTQRWTGFPDPMRQESRLKEKKEEEKKPKEKSLYDLFCAIAEAIRGFAEKQRPTTLQMGDTKWVDYHTKSPQSQDRQGAQLRPDVLFALQVIADQTVLKECQVRVSAVLNRLSMLTGRSKESRKGIERKRSRKKMGWRKRKRRRRRRRRGMW